jgi:hypothetical protein
METLIKSTTDTMKEKQESHQPNQANGRGKEEEEGQEA